MKRIYILLFLILLPGTLFAASINLTSPISPVFQNAGDEFFTDIKYDPIDFDERRDLLWEEHFDEDSLTNSNGIWSADYDGSTVGGSGAYIFPHFQGIPGALNAGFTGVNYPLDTSKYRYVSLMNKVSERTVRRMYWTRDENWPNGDYKTAGTDGTFQTGSSGEVDGYCTNNIAVCRWDNEGNPDTTILHEPNDWVIYLIDLSAKDTWTEANLTGIRFDASPKATAGSNISYQWFRVIDPDTSPILDITWTTSDVTASNAKVNIYIDDDASGFDGAFLTRVDYDDNGFSFPSSALPPGTYYIYLELYDNIDSDTLLATSQYSAAVTINAKSSISFSSPSKTSGSDYATEVLQDPWDMDSFNDIANISNPSYQQCFVGEQINDSVFIALAVIDSGQANTAHSDVQVWLNVDEQSPIDTSRYRYLTYTLSADPTHYGNISDKVSKGWITRFIWWTDGLGIDGEQSNDVLLYEDTHSYSIDLHADIIEPASALSGMAWQDNPTVANVRIDPLETSNTEGTVFYLYDVKLTANPEPESDGSFTAEFTVQDPESELMLVDFFLGSDSSGSYGTHLGTQSYTSGTHQYTFQTCDLDPGDYYLYAIVTDTAGNTTQRYADVPITVQSTVVCETFDILDLYMMGILPAITASQSSSNP